MRNTIKIGIIIFLCVWPAVKSLGQEDTLKHNEGEDSYRINARYRDRTMALSVNAIGGTMHNYQYGIGTAVEFKIRDYHSLGGGINLWHSEDWSDLMGYYFTETCLQVEMEYRYYHNLKNRMSKGRTGNNFSANYILVSPSFYLQYKRYILEDYYWDFTQGLWVLEYNKPLVIRPVIRIGYGIQRTFWRNLKFDINAGIQFQKGISSFKPVELFQDLNYIRISFGYIIK